MKKVLFVATVVKTHIMEFHIPYLKLFKEHGWETTVIAKNDYENPNDCQIPYCDHYYDIPIERNPISFNNYKAFRQLKKLLNENHYDIIHCHTPVGGLLGRLASQKSRKELKTRVIYTAHGFHFYKGAPTINWIVYYPVEKTLSWLTDAIITINKEDYELAKRKFHAKEIVYIPGVGVDFERLNIGENRLSKKTFREQFNIPPNGKIILSVGELNDNKNHRVVINAIKSLDNYYYIICGSGPLHSGYRQLAKELGVEDRIIMPGYRDDVNVFYSMADYFAFPSYREGLPVSIIEAMAFGLPILCTDIRGSSDLVEEEINGVFFDPNSSKSFIEALQKLNSLDLKKISDNNIRKAKLLSTDVLKEQYAKVYKLNSENKERK